MSRVSAPQSPFVPQHTQTLKWRADYILIDPRFPFSYLFQRQEYLPYFQLSSNPIFHLWFVLVMVLIWIHMCGVFFYSNTVKWPN